jgi:hypothetical protein
MTKKRKKEFVRHLANTAAGLRKDRKEMFGKQDYMDGIIRGLEIAARSIWKTLSSE